MKILRPHKDRSLTPIDYISLEDIEKDIQNLRSYSNRFKSSQDIHPADLLPRKTTFNGGYKSNSPQSQEGLKHGREEGDVAFNLDTAENQIKSMSEDLLRDYSTDILLPKSKKFFENQIKERMGTKQPKYIGLPNDEAFFDYPEHLPETETTLEYFRKFSALNPASKYPGQFPDNKATLKYHDQLSDDKATLDYPKQPDHKNTPVTEKVPDHKPVLKYPKQPGGKDTPEYYEKLPDHKPILKYHKQPGGKDTPEYYEKLPDHKPILKYHKQPGGKDTPEYYEKLPDHKPTLEHPGKLPTGGIISQLQGQLADYKAILDYNAPFPYSTGVSEDKSQVSDAAATNEHIGQQAQINNVALPIVMNPFDRDNKIDQFSREYDTVLNPKLQSNAAGSPTFDANQNKDTDIDFLHQIQLELDSLKKEKDANIVIDGTIPNSGTKIWSQINAHPATIEQENAGNFVSRFNKADVASRKTKSNIGIKRQQKSKLNVNDASKEMKTTQDLSENIPDITRFFSNFHDKTREMAGNKNQVVRNRKIYKIESKADVSRIRANGKQTTGNKSNGTRQIEHAVVKDSRRLSNDLKDPVSLEKRRGNNAGRNRNKNQHKSYNIHPSKPKPQPQQQPIVTTQLTTTFEESNTTDVNTLTAFVSSRGTTARMMNEIVDNGVDKIDIPLSGSPPWHARIHGRRDIVLAGAIMGGVGLLLIILSIIYILVNRKSSQQKTTKKDKGYRKLGSKDEKAGLTEEVQHSLFPLSSDEMTTDESDEEMKHPQGKINKDENY